MEDFAGDVAFEASHDLVFGFALPEAAGEVVAGGLVTTKAHDQDDVQGSVGVAVATAVELVPDRFAAGCFQWADSAEFDNKSLIYPPRSVTT